MAKEKEKEKVTTFTITTGIQKTGGRSGMRMMVGVLISPTAPDRRRKESPRKKRATSEPWRSITSALRKSWKMRVDASALR